MGKRQKMKKLKLLEQRIAELERECETWKTAYECEREIIRETGARRCKFYVRHFITEELLDGIKTNEELIEGVKRKVAYEMAKNIYESGAYGLMIEEEEEEISVRCEIELLMPEIQPESFAKYVFCKRKEKEMNS